MRSERALRGKENFVQEEIKKEVLSSGMHFFSKAKDECVFLWSEADKKGKEGTRFEDNMSPAERGMEL
jgi:hypothetical protein